MKNTTLTLGALQNLVKVDKKIKSTPGHKQLKAMDSQVLLENKFDDETEVTVYENGYALYSKIVDGVKRFAVFSILNMKLCYEFSSNALPPIYINNFPVLRNWLAIDVIKLCGDEQILMNRYDREKKKVDKNLDSDGNYYEAATRTGVRLHHSYDYDLAQHYIDLEERTRREKWEEKMLSKLDDVLSHLTQKQSIVIELHFKESLSERQIGEKLGISRDSVHSSLEGSYKKLKKLLLKEF